jgi:DNA-binding SARP family transcriptional activator
VFQLRVFGGLTLAEDGRVLEAALEHRKAMLLLAIVATAGQEGVPREKLQTLLWEESDDRRGRGALKQMLHTLRRRFGTPSVILGVSQLRLNPEVVSSDLVRFLDELRRGDREAAVREYYGPFLDGVRLAGTRELEHWVDSKRARLEAQYVEALESLARLADTSEDPLGAVRWWRMLRDADPLNGRIRVGLMRALLRAGDRPAALREADLHAKLLRRELEVGPDPEVVSLRDRLQW